MAGRPKGQPKSGGRKKGTPNKVASVKAQVSQGMDARIQAQIELIKANADPGVAEAVAATLDELMRLGNAKLSELIPKGTPLVYMLEIMHSETQPATFRFEAAKAAAAYLHSKTAEAPAAETDTRKIVKIEREIVHRRDPDNSDSSGVPAAADAGPVQGRTWRPR